MRFPKLVAMAFTLQNLQMAEEFRYNIRLKEMEENKQSAQNAYKIGVDFVTNQPTYRIVQGAIKQ